MRRTRSPLIPQTGELALIESIRRRAGNVGGGGVSLGIGDDCALLRIKPGEEVAITTDLSVAGRHFRLDWHPAEAVGHRALARGLSDLAAMGARPVAAFLSLGLPRDLTVGKRGKRPWVERFFDGLLALATRHRVPLAGGDLAESPLAMADIVLVGAVPRGRALLRSGARPGDLLYVTGVLGGSAAGLQRLRRSLEENARTRHRASDLANALVPHLWPEPRIPQALWLQRRGAASSAIDISDGLSTDLEHICVESRVCAEVDLGSLPIFPDASVEQALHGGEDYELLFTARPGTRIPKSLGGVRLTRIGRIIKARSDRPRLVLITREGTRALLHGGWEHFTGKGSRTGRTRLST